jgi:glycosyltransferase involved in cell wall biosynthesis
VIDTVEVFSRNTKQFAQAGVAPNLVCSRDSEITALRRADLVVGIQRDDTEFLRGLVPMKRVITVGHVYPEARSRATSPRTGVVLYVGSSNEYNRHGLMLFIRHAWPKIRNACPEAVLEVVGDVRSGSPYEGVKFSGRVDDEELARRYQAAHVVINPQVAGTGLKIKCVEALSAGCPLVVNEAGADGLGDGAGKAFRVAHGWDEFADHVVRLLQNDAERLALELEARRFAVRRFSRSAVFGELDKFLDDHLVPR